MKQMSEEMRTGSAERWGPLWGARASAWAEVEDRQLPTYEEAIHRVGIGAGMRVLDVGCGTGRFLKAAADVGSDAWGLDASEELLEIARDRVPAAELSLGDMQALPYAEDTFDVVTGFNSFFFASDLESALREAGRVARSGAAVVIQVWVALSTASWGQSRARSRLSCLLPGRARRSPSSCGVKEFWRRWRPGRASSPISRSIAIGRSSSRTHRAPCAA